MELQYSIQDCMHLFPPWINTAVTMFLTLLLLYILYRLYGIYRKYLESKRRVSSKQSYQTKSHIDPVKTAIEKIRIEGHSSNEYRNCLFKISSLLRSYLTAKTGRDVETLTASQMKREFSSKNPAAYFSKLGSVIYSKGEITSGEFDELCDGALKSARGRIRKR